MTKEVYQNEQKKREFLEYLKGAEGFSESSINAFAEAVDQWQEFTKNEDFINFNKSKALAFRDWLKTRKSNTETGMLSLTTQYSYLRRVKRFFTWLSNQPDYQNKITKNEVEFLRLSKGDARIARQGTTKQIPTIEEAKTIINSIEIKNEIDIRDRASICLAITTGMRISALATLKIKNFDPDKKIFDQNPADGVKTKNSKRIFTTFFPIGWDKPEKYFLEWFEYLKKKGFQPNNPLFPATLNNINDDKESYSKNNIGTNMWRGTAGARKIFEKRCHNAKVPYFHPHSFRHLIVSFMSEARLTEKEKKAISLNLGHSNIGTTFGSYGYGNMTEEDAVKIVQKLKNPQSNKNTEIISDDEKAILKRLMERIL